MGNSENFQEGVSLSDAIIQSETMSETTIIDTTEVVAGNERIQVLKTVNSINLQVAPFYKKENRKKFSGDNLIELFEKATKNCFARINWMTPIILE